MVNLLRNVLRSELLKVNKPILSKGLSSLLRLCLIYRMKSIISLVWNSWQSFPMADLKYGQYVLLQAFDHRSDGVRNGVQTVFAQIWRQDIDWAFGFLLRVLTQMLPTAKRASLFSLIRTYVGEVSAVRRWVWVQIGSPYFPLQRSVQSFEIFCLHQMSLMPHLPRCGLTWVLTWLAWCHRRSC